MDHTEHDTVLAYPQEGLHMTYQVRPVFYAFISGGPHEIVDELYQTVLGNAVRILDIQFDSILPQFIDGPVDLQMELAVFIGRIVMVVIMVMVFMIVVMVVIVVMVMVFMIVVMMVIMVMVMVFMIVVMMVIMVVIVVMHLTHQRCTASSEALPRSPCRNVRRSLSRWPQPHSRYPHLSMQTSS